MSIAAALRRRCFGYALGVGKRPYERNQSCIKSAKRFRPPLSAFTPRGAYPTHSTPPPSLRCVIWRSVSSLRDDGPYGGAISRPRIVRIAPDPPFGALCNALPQRCSKALHRFRTGRRARVGSIGVSHTCPGTPRLYGECSRLVSTIRRRFDGVWPCRPPARAVRRSVWNAIGTPERRCAIRTTLYAVARQPSLTKHTRRGRTTLQGNHQK